MTEVITEITSASGLDFEALKTEAITSNLMITLLHCGLSVSQISAIYDTGASKPFVKTVRECIKGILVTLPASATVTTATSNASAVSISLRRYNFAITSDMVEVAARVRIDISKYDVITVLAAPLVCADFQQDFDILSAPVFKDLGIIMEHGRGRHEADFLSLHEKPNLRAKMGHRKNGLPVVFLVPDCIVEEHRLRRLQHHTLTTYSDAEGIRLLKEQWESTGSSGAYLTALDDCYTAALLNGGPQRHLKDNMPRDPLSERRSSSKEHACSKVAYGVTFNEPVPASIQAYNTEVIGDMPSALFATGHSDAELHGRAGSEYCGDEQAQPLATIHRRTSGGSGKTPWKNNLGYHGSAAGGGNPPPRQIAPDRFAKRRQDVFAEVKQARSAFPFKRGENAPVERPPRDAPRSFQRSKSTPPPRRFNAPRAGRPSPIRHNRFT